MKEHEAGEDRVSRFVVVDVAESRLGGMSAACHYLFGVNAITAGFACLVAILVIAASWGLPEALVASIAATSSLSFFFLPPIGRLAIADPENWMALIAFLATSLQLQIVDRGRQPFGPSEYLWIFYRFRTPSSCLSGYGLCRRCSDQRR